MVYEILKFDKYEGEGGKGSYDRGVLSVTLSKWSDFYEEVRRFRDCKHYVWRGQRCGYPEWKLKSKFDRLSNSDDRNKLLKKHLEQFKMAIRGRRGANPPKLDDDELWALGQHHGLKHHYLIGRNRLSWRHILPSLKVWNLMIRENQSGLYMH